MSNSLLSEILTGQHDEYLDRILNAVRERRDIQSRIKFVEFEVGDKVRFTRATRPTYLQGVEGVIEKKLQKKVAVRLSNPVGRFRGAITTPISLIEKL